MMKKYFMLFFIVFCAVHVTAQEPNWTVNSSDYQYSMTFTVFLNVDGTTLTSVEDKVGAFVNGELRGVANVIYAENADKYVAYLSVYANRSDEIISFKIYDSTNDTVIDVAENQDYVIDGNVGGIFQSYSIANPALKNETVLNSFSFSGITTVSQSIINNEIAIVVPSGTDITNLSAEFSVSDGARFFVGHTEQISGSSLQDFTNLIKYKLLSEDEGLLIEYDVTVTIGNVTIDPPEIVLNSDRTTDVKQAPVLISMETNVAITDFVSEDVLLTNAIISSIKKESELIYKLEIAPIQQGEFSIEIPENVVLNNSDQGNLVSNKLIFNYDLVNPYLLSIKRKNPTEEIIKSDSLEFIVLFSEDVENVFSTDFESVSNAIFSVEETNKSTYIITVSGIENYVGAVSLKLKATNTIQDKAGNLLLNSVINVHQKNE